MKRLLFLLLAMFITTAAEAQRRVTLRQCEGDTVAYLRQNFEQGKARFVGKPFSKVIQEWQQELPVGRLLYGSTGPWPVEESQRNVINGVSLHFTTEEEENLRRHRKEAYYVLAVIFRPPYYQKTQDLYDLREQEEVQLGPKQYDLIKDYIIEDLVIVTQKLGR